MLLLIYMTVLKSPIQIALSDLDHVSDIYVDEKNRNGNDHHESVAVDTGSLASNYM